MQTQSTNKTKVNAESLIREMQAGGLQLNDFQLAIARHIDGLRHTPRSERAKELDALSGSPDERVREIAGIIKDALSGRMTTTRAIETAQAVVHAAKRRRFAVVFSAAEVRAMASGATSRPTGSIADEIAKFQAMAESTKRSVPASFFREYEAETRVAHNLVKQLHEAAIAAEHTSESGRLLADFMVMTSYGILAETRAAAEYHTNQDHALAYTHMAHVRDLAQDVADFVALAARVEHTDSFASRWEEHAGRLSGTHMDLLGKFRGTSAFTAGGA